MNLIRYSSLLSLLFGALVAACSGPAAPLAAADLAQPASPYDAAPPEITQWMQAPAILVYSKTLGWRHTEAIAGADKCFVDRAGCLSDQD